MQPAPVLFISHGAPTFALEPGELGHQLTQLGSELTDIDAIVAVSPHWETHGLRVASQRQPQTIHDFHGFPEPLYQLQYPAPGSPEVAQSVLTALHQAGLAAEPDPVRGMDHGVWVPLRHLRPDADIPVVCVSLPIDARPQRAWQLGRALAPLREQRVMVMGTGSLTHNLAEFRGPAVTNTAPYVTDFTQWIRSAIQARHQEALLDYREQAPAARRAHPTEEHLLPLFVALGASTERDAFDVLSTEVRYGMLSMESYRWQ